MTKPDETKLTAENEDEELELSKETVADLDATEEESELVMGGMSATCGTSEGARRC